MTYENYNRLKKEGVFVGIDEVGRGPLAGPVTVCAVLAAKRLLTLSFFPKIKDSKQLNPQKRRKIFENLNILRKRGEILFSISSVGVRVIDRVGINRAIRIAVARCLSKISLAPSEVTILLDGGLRAPKKYLFQETITGGDEKEALIALASIVGKVLRDEKMERLAQRVPWYGFDKHKGYGTEEHRRLLRRYGISSFHRKKFVRKIFRHS